MVTGSLPRCDPPSTGWLCLHKNQAAPINRTTNKREKKMPTEARNLPHRVLAWAAMSCECRISATSCSNSCTNVARKPISCVNCFRRVPCRSSILVEEKDHREGIGLERKSALQLRGASAMEGDLALLEICVSSFWRSAMDCRAVLSSCWARLTASSEMGSKYMPAMHE